MYDRFYPGRPWLDTKGERIQAHGGSVICADGTFYWYGENKEKTDGKNGIWTWGVRCYRSQDLYNWEDCGLIIPPDLEDAASPLNPYHAMMDRPHIIYNESTQKYVCWMKVMRSDGTQTQTIMTADRILGPYVLVRKDFRPLGMDGGDFDLAVGPDGKAYYYFERVHSETICVELTEDYTDVTSRFSRHFPHPNPPYVREATAHFVRNGKHYLITSGTTGYLPNPSEAAVADTWHGPYRVLGNPHPDDPTRTSYHSQISSIFKVPGKKDLYIACADRWCPGEMDFSYDFYGKAFDLRFTGKEKEIPALAKKMGISEREVKGVFSDDARNTSIADYVWLPLRFEKDMVYIDWRDEWKLSDYPF